MKNYDITAVEYSSLIINHPYSSAKAIFLRSLLVARSPGRQVAGRPLLHMPGILQIGKGGVAFERLTVIFWGSAPAPPQIPPFTWGGLPPRPAPDMLSRPPASSFTSCFVIFLLNSQLIGRPEADKKCVGVWGGLGRRGGAPPEHYRCKLSGFANQVMLEWS